MKDKNMTTVLVVDQHSQLDYAIRNLTWEQAVAFAGAKTFQTETPDAERPRFTTAFYVRGADGRPDLIASNWDSGD